MAATGASGRRNSIEAPTPNRRLTFPTTGRKHMSTTPVIQPAPPRSWNYKSALMKKEIGTFLLLLVLCIVVSILNPRFLAGANLQNMARLIGAYGIFSIGLGIVIITGGI